MIVDSREQRRRVRTVHIGRCDEVEDVPLDPGRLMIKRLGGVLRARCAAKTPSQPLATGRNPVVPGTIQG
jgi:hypothetical protein